MWTSLGYHLQIIWTLFRHHLDIIWASDIVTLQSELSGHSSQISSSLQEIEDLKQELDMIASRDDEWTHQASSIMFANL